MQRALKEELKQRVEASRARIRKIYAEESVEWDVNNHTREKRAQAFRFRLSGSGSALTFQQDTGKKGTAVWSAGIQLARYLEHRFSSGQRLSKKRVLELGSGTGIVGVVAASLGARATLSDLPAVIPWTLKNAQTNALEIKNAGGSVVVVPLPWGREPGESQRGLGGPFDYVFGSDLVYTPTIGQSLLKTILDIFRDKRLVSNTSQLLLALDRRGRAGARTFLSALGQHFELHEVPLSETVSMSAHICGRQRTHC